MATKTTATKAKVKTSGAKSAKTAVKSAKTVSATTKTKVTVKKTNRSFGARQIHALCVVLFVGLGILALTNMTNASSEVTLTHLTRDVLFSTKETVFAAAGHHLWDIQIRWLVAVVMGLSALFSLLYITRYQKGYEAAVARKVVLWRWFEFALIGMLMAETTALVTGYQDLATLKLVGLGTVLVAAFGWLAEKQNAASARVEWGAFSLGLFTTIVLAVVLGGSLLGTLLFSSVRASWYVYALSSGFIVYLFVRSWLQYKQLKGRDYAVTDRNYMILQMLTKLGFAAVLIFGLFR